MTHYSKKDSRIDRILRRVIVFVVVMTFMIPLCSPNVFADTAITIAGGDHVKGGDTFTVAVTFGDGSVGRVDAQLLYDTNMLTYVSGGSSEGNTGYIQLKKAGTEGSITFNIEFQAVSDGQATIEVTTNDMFDLDEMYLDRPTASKVINITGNAEEEALITETASPDQPPEETEPVGVDEKPDENVADGINLNLVFIIAAAVLVILIVIISIILAKKKKGGSGSDGQTREEQIYEESFGQAPRVGRSGRILEPHPEQLDHPDYEEDHMRRNRAERADRAEKEAVRKRAKEETEVWTDWNLNDDGPDDIEKW